MILVNFACKSKWLFYAELKEKYMKWDPRIETIGETGDPVLGLDSRSEFLQKNIKRKYCQTKRIVESSEIFRHTH